MFVVMLTNQQQRCIGIIDVIISIQHQLTKVQCCIFKLLVTWCTFNYMFLKTEE